MAQERETSWVDALKRRGQLVKSARFLTEEEAREDRPQGLIVIELEDGTEVVPKREEERWEFFPL